MTRLRKLGRVPGRTTWSCAARRAAAGSVTRRRYFKAPPVAMRGRPRILALIPSHAPSDALPRRDHERPDESGGEGRRLIAEQVAGGRRPATDGHRVASRCRGAGRFVGRCPDRGGAPPRQGPRRPTRALVMYLLDTNTLIYFFKGMGRVAERLLSTAPAETAVSAISVYELEVGIAKSDSPGKRRKQLEAFLDVAPL